jgi:hypothetical protein
MSFRLASHYRVILIAIVAACSMTALAQERAPEEKEAQQARLEEALQLSLKGAQSYEFMPDGPSSASWAFRREPVLRWSNPERGEIYGYVFLWTDRGRPEVVGSLFKWYSPFTHASHEFESLSPSSFVTRRDGMQVWQSTKPGIELRPLPDAPAPAGTASGRLLQMKELARRFAARSTDREGMQLQLRLLPQPIYRYERPTEVESMPVAWRDGALFVFVQGTDPEVFLMLEARERQGSLQWEYAIARMNSIAFRVTYQDREIWSAEVLPWRDVTSHREPYTSFGFNQPVRK